MVRWHAVATLSIAGTLLSCSPARLTEESRPDDQTLFEAGSHCPLLASSCPAGCHPAGGFRIDAGSTCKVPNQHWGCSALEVGPPAVICSVLPDGTIWVSLDGRQHPRGRSCTREEHAAIDYPACR